MDKRGKITLSVLIISVVLVGFFSLYSVFAIEENTKEYDSINKVVTIKNPAGEVISDITLNTPLNNIVPRGYQKVAEFTMNLSKDEYSNAFEKIEFYDLNKDNENFLRDFDYRYKTFENVEVNDYKESCEQLENGTATNCQRIITGTHTEQREVWDILDTSVLYKGEITVGIFTEVKKGDNVEWIPTFLGVEIDEWAVWTEDLNVDLMSYFSFDEPSGTNMQNNATKKDAGWNYNGTAVNGTLVGQPGKLGKAITVGDHGNYGQAVTVAQPTPTAGLSISAWISGTPTAQRPFVGGYPNFRFGIRGTGDNNVLETVIDQDGGSKFNGVSNVTDFTWHHVVQSWSVSSNNHSIWVDGVLENSAAYNTAQGSEPGFAIGAWDLDVTAITGWGFNGSIDEVAIWNRSLTISEVADLYNGGAGIPYGVDSQNYTITFNLTDSGTGQQIDTSKAQDNFDISCDNGYIVGDQENTHTTNNTFSGTVECTFSGLTIDNGVTFYRDKNQTITVDSNKTVEVPMSRIGGLTEEEHGWLEAIYNCVILNVSCSSHF